MLGLKMATDPRWVNLAEKEIKEVLIDHAYCEQKAASTCISLIVQFSDKQKLVDELTPIVSEEWSHFRMVLAELKKRGYDLGPSRNDEYVIALSKLANKGGSREDQLVERLLIAGLIEARSCERFRLLSEGIADDELKTFYRDLMISEAGHYRLFLDLARVYADNVDVKTRFNELLAGEVEILKNLEVRGDRVH